MVFKLLMRASHLPPVKMMEKSFAPEKDKIHIKSKKVFYTI